jgi:hypothetical protein
MNAPTNLMHSPRHVFMFKRKLQANTLSNNAGDMLYRPISTYNGANAKYVLVLAKFALAPKSAGQALPRQRLCIQHVAHLFDLEAGHLRKCHVRNKEREGTLTLF